VAVLLVSAILNVAAARRRGSTASPDAGPWARAPRWQRAVFLLTVAACAAATCDRALLRGVMPVVEGDEAFIWAARAKVLVASGGLNDRYGAEVLDAIPETAPAVSHPDYPILNSLLQAVTFINAGRVTHFENRLPIQAFALALTLAAAAALRRVSPPLVAAGLLVLLHAQRWVADMAGPAMADGMVALGLLVALDCWLRERDGGGAPWARFGGLALALLAWSKHEGAMVAALTAAGVVLAGPRDARRLVRWLLPPAIVVLATWATNAAFGFRNDLAQHHADGTIWTRFLPALSGRGADVAALAWRDFLAAPRVSGLLAFGLVLGLLVPAVRRDRRVVAAAAVLLFALAVDVAVFVATPNDLAWHWRTAGPRVLSQLNPAIALVVGAMAGLAGTPDRRLESAPKGTG
jgi:hypothetical protein